MSNYLLIILSSSVIAISLYGNSAVFSIPAKNNVYKMLITTNEKEYLIKKKFIRMCVHPNALPFEAIRNKNYRCFSWTKS